MQQYFYQKEEADDKFRLVSGNDGVTMLLPSRPGYCHGIKLSDCTYLNGCCICQEEYCVHSGNGRYLARVHYQHQQHNLMQDAH
jgi:hypothetical protein